MLGRVALVRAEISEELRAYFIRLTRIGDLRTTLAVTTASVKTDVSEELSASFMRVTRISNYS
jgi:DNA-binding TFAR19-related protein (PDSD5 family)